MGDSAASRRHLGRLPENIATEGHQPPCTDSQDAPVGRVAGGQIRIRGGLPPSAPSASLRTSRESVWLAERIDELEANNAALELRVARANTALATVVTERDALCAELARIDQSSSILATRHSARVRSRVASTLGRKCGWDRPCLHDNLGIEGRDAGQGAP